MTKRAVGASAKKKAPARKTPKPRAKPVAAKATDAQGFNHGGTKQTERDLPGALTPDEEAFVTEYLRNGLNGTAAILRNQPHLTPQSAAVKASRLLKVDKVRNRVRSERIRIAQAHEATREELLGELMKIVRADPNELTSMRAVACERCWGGEETPVGPDAADTEKKAKPRLMFHVDPDPECLVCNGEGHAVLHVADTRKLSPEAAALFQGVHETKDGIKILMHSKLDALEKAAKIIGAYELDNRQKLDPLAALLQGIGRSALPVVKDARGG